MSVYIDAQTCVSVDDGRRYSSNDDRTEDHYNHNMWCIQALSAFETVDSGAWIAVVEQ